MSDPKRKRKVSISRNEGLFLGPLAQRESTFWPFSFAFHQVFGDSPIQIDCRKRVSLF